MKKRLKFEDLANKCFNDFPQVFCLKGYPELIDTRKLDRPLRSLRKDGLIKGSPDSFFSLTEKGRKLGEELSKVIYQRKLF